MKSHLNRIAFWFVSLLLLQIPATIDVSEKNQKDTETIPTWTSTIEADPPETYERDRIQPYKQDPRYWQYQGVPVLLIGASNEDNLFNHPDLNPDGLEAHLEQIQEVGGNYVRNTMSSRDEGNVWPFHQRDDGLYDLRLPNEVYWQRFEQFLKMTGARGIITQVEVWDRFDYAREPWQANPFNPKNNINYTAVESGLPETIDSHPGARENPFFRSIPELEDIDVIRPFQEAHVERMLEIALKYDHVLYCISNETNDTEEWSRYWARFIHELADRAERDIELTEMWDAWDLQSDMHDRTFDHPELYSFVDVSQNSHQTGQEQWDNLQWARQRVSDPPRPVNNIKTYGGQHGGGAEEGQHKLWRNVLGGAATSRYHRPGGGIGLNTVTAAHLQSLGMVLEHVDIFAAEPSDDLLDEREEDETYLSAVPGHQYVLYFPDGGQVMLDLSEVTDSLTMRWLNVLEHRWDGDWESVPNEERIELKTPNEGPWAVVLVVQGKAQQAGN